MVAHFSYKDALKLHNPSQQARFYKNKVAKYFTFPKNFSNAVSIHDFAKIEKANKTSIWLYQIVKVWKSRDIRFSCKGNYLSVLPDRVIHACQVENTSYIVLVKETQNFNRCARPKHSSKKVLAGGVFCKICFCNRHFNQCERFTYKPS